MKAILAAKNAIYECELDHRAGHRPRVPQHARRPNGPSKSRRQAPQYTLEQRYEQLHDLRQKYERMSKLGPDLPENKVQLFAFKQMGSGRPIKCNMYVILTMLCHSPSNACTIGTLETYIEHEMFNTWQEIPAGSRGTEVGNCAKQALQDAVRGCTNFTPEQKSKAIAQLECLPDQMTHKQVRNLTNNDAGQSVCFQKVKYQGTARGLLRHLLTSSTPSVCTLKGPAHMIAIVPGGNGTAAYIVDCCSPITGKPKTTIVGYQDGTLFPDEDLDRIWYADIIGDSTMAADVADKSDAGAERAEKLKRKAGPPGPEFASQLHLKRCKKRRC